MGFFSKKPKINPTIETDGLRIEYDTCNGYWQFKHKGVDFVIYDTTFVVPTQERLSSILTDINRLRQEMVRRLADGWKDSEGVKMNDGETYLVNLTELQSQSIFEVSWSGGESWGDMGIEFTIKNHAVTDETWGD